MCASVCVYVRVCVRGYRCLCHIERVEVYFHLVYFFSFLFVFFCLVFSICNAIFRFWPAGIVCCSVLTTPRLVARRGKCVWCWWLCVRVCVAAAKLVWRRLKVVQGVRYKFAVPAVCLHASQPRRCHWPRLSLSHSLSLSLSLCLSFHNFPQLANASAVDWQFYKFANCKLHFHNLIKCRIDCCCCCPAQCGMFEPHATWSHIAHIALKRAYSLPRGQRGEIA